MVTSDSYANILKRFRFGKCDPPSGSRKPTDLSSLPTARGVGIVDLGGITVQHVAHNQFFTTNADPTMVVIPTC